MRYSDLRTWSFLPALGFAALFACDSATGPEEESEPRVTSIRVEFTASPVVEGGVTQATAVVLDQNGRTMSGISVGWSSSAPEIASISSDGSVDAHMPGTASIQATAESVTGQAMLTVIVNGWTALAAGRDHSCGTRADGRVFCWGKNDLGQLGAGMETSSNVPTLVALPQGVDVVQVEAAGEQTCVLTADGAVYCWGENLRGELGNGTTTNSSVPVRVVSNATFTTISMGPHHACALDGSEAAHCWGGGISTPGGDLALGFEPPDLCPQSFAYFSTRCSMVPRPLPTPLRFSSISAGLFLTCARATDGAGYCWGWNRYAQLGDGPGSTVDPGSTVPQPIAGGVQFESLSAGSLHGCGIGTGGAAYCWGAKWPTPNQFNLGQLGAGDHPNSNGSDVPRPVVGGLSFTALTTNDENNVRGLHTCGVATSGQAYCWGANEEGQLGSPALDQCAAITNSLIPCTSTPQPVSGGLGVTSIRTGVFHTCALGLDSEIYCWGKNDHGQLGDGTTISRGDPVRVTRE